MLTAVETISALARGDVSAVELAEASLAAARALQERCHPFVGIDDEGALAAARDADRRRGAGEDGPLLGVPIGIKDDLDVAGRVVSRGSAAMTRPARADAPLVAALRAAGTVPIGATTLPEIAAYGFTESAHLGVTRNPADPARTPGGSSGGSAAAVAGGVVPIATAGDGAGSIRIPAACCGLPGFKPSTGRVPGGGGWNGLAVLGCLTRTLADAALFLDAVGDVPGTPGGAPGGAGPDPRAQSLVHAARVDPPPLRIGVDLRPTPALVPAVGLDPDVAGAVRATADRLADLGHEVRDVRIPWGTAPLASTVRYLRSLAEAGADVDEPARLEARTREVVRIGGLVPARLAGPAGRAGRRFGARVLGGLGVDVLLTPVMRGPAPEIGRWAGSGGLATMLGMSRFYAHTLPWNHTGQPAVSVPTGRSRAGLPLAVQLVGPPDGDATLMALAAQVERARSG